MGISNQPSLFTFLVNISFKENQQTLKRCAKLTDGNERKQFLLIVVIDKRDHFNQKLQIQ